jgi:hypothetical protein
MAIPKEKKRRDKSGINQLKKAGEKKISQSGLPKQTKSEIMEENEQLTKVMFLVNENDPENPDVFAYFPEIKHQGIYRTVYSHIGQHSAIHPEYANESRQATPEEYQDLKTELENIGYNLDVINKDGISETTSAGGGTAVAAGIAGGNNSSSTGQYSGPAAWGSGDLMKTKEKSKIMRKPIWNGGTIIQESNYLIDPSGFEKYIFDLNEQLDFIRKNTEGYGDLKNMNPENLGIIKTDIQTGKMDDPNLGLDEEAKSKSQQRLFGMAHAAQMGDIPMGKLGSAAKKIAKTVSSNDVEDFAKTKHKDLPEKIKEDTTTMANASKLQSREDSMSNKMETSIPIGTQQSGGMNESNKNNNDMALLEELNKELEAFSIHHKKLVKMSEDRKISAEVDRQRVINQNPTNFKRDLQHSGTKEIINVEKELQWKDQQTDIKDPQKLGLDIEKQTVKLTDATGDEHLKNVGNSTNNNGDEIPKRNRTTEEQEEVDLYTKGLHSTKFDIEPSERFENRMKADMGEDFYNRREKQLKDGEKQPLYNKESVPTYKGEELNQFNKYRDVNESMITGRYFDILGKRKLIDFMISEVKLNESINELNDENVNNLFELDFTGLGNTYNSKTINNKVTVNENIIRVMEEHKFYTDGKKIYAIKKSLQNLNEDVNKKQVIINEQYDKMKHLLGYKPQNFVDTKNVKKNRGF